MYVNLSCMSNMFIYSRFRWLKELKGYLNSNRKLKKVTSLTTREAEEKREVRKKPNLDYTILEGGMLDFNKLKKFLCLTYRILDMLDVVDVLSSIILAVFTVVLAISTIYYAFKTRDMVREMKLSRIPHITCFLKPLGPVSWILVICNSGKGVAKDIELEITSKPPTIKRSWKAEYLLPGEQHHFAPVVLSSYGGDKSLFSFEELSNYKIEICGRYYDIYEKEPYTLHETIDIKQKTEIVKSAHELIVIDVIDVMKDLVKQIEKINATLKKVQKKTKD